MILVVVKAEVFTSAILRWLLHGYSALAVQCPDSPAGPSTRFLICTIPWKIGSYCGNGHPPHQVDE